MGVVDLKDIAALFASRTKLGDIESEAFINSMFFVIRQGLETDRQIKIRGFGTFKIIDVEARESVSVNTGERVVIGSHRKVTFTPDATMKELVNKPFSLFNTVDLNDGVVFDDPDAEQMDTDSQETDTDNENPSVSDYDDSVEEITDETSSSAEQTEMTSFDGGKASATEVGAASDNEASFDDSNEEKRETEEEEKKAETEDGESVGSDCFETEDLQTEPSQEAVEPSVPIGDEDTTSLDSAEIVHAEEQVETESGTTSLPQENEDSVSQAEDGKEQTTDDDVEEEQCEMSVTSAHKTRNILLYGLLTLVLMAASAYGGMLYGEQVARENSGCNLEKAALQQTSLPTAPRRVAPTTQQRLDTAKTDTLKKSKKEDARETETTASREDKSQDNKADKKAGIMQVAAKYAKKDARVRTGAYYIVGTERTVVLKQNESLTRISNRELGPGMECYLEVFNDLREDSELKAGQTIKIPTLVLKKSVRKGVK